MKTTTALTQEQVERVSSVYGAEFAAQEQKRRVSANYRQMKAAALTCGCCGGKLNRRGDCNNCEG